MKTNHGLIYIYISADVLCFCWVRFASTKKEKQRNTQKRAPVGRTMRGAEWSNIHCPTCFPPGTHHGCNNVATSKVYVVYQQEGHQETELAVTSECQVENVNSIHQHPACLPPEPFGRSTNSAKEQGGSGQVM